MRQNGRHVPPGWDVLVPPSCLDVILNKTANRPSNLFCSVLRVLQMSQHSWNEIIVCQKQAIINLGAGLFCVRLSFFWREDVSEKWWWATKREIGEGKQIKTRNHFLWSGPRRNSNVSLFCKNYAVCITSMTLGNCRVYHANVILYKYPAVSASNPKFLQLLEYWFISGSKLLVLVGSAATDMLKKLSVLKHIKMLHAHFLHTF